MGYRSDVAIKCESKAFEILKKEIKKGIISPHKIYQDEFGYTLLYWEWMKWYEDDPEVQKVTEIMCDLNHFVETEGYGYVFVRLGEEYDDVSIERNSWDIELPLIHKIDISGNLRELDLEEEGIEQIKVGDAVCVTMLPSRDIYGNEYDEKGGGGIVLQVKEHSTIIKLFDGFIIEADGTEFARY